jgi:hypothetical protein
MLSTYDLRHMTYDTEGPTTDIETVKPTVQGHWVTDPLVPFAGPRSGRDGIAGE